jgi:hypothetical protein
VTLVKSGGSADGPLHVLLTEGGTPRLALPVRGAVQARGRYRLETLPAFRCVTRPLDPDAPFDAQLAAIAGAARAAGHKPSGEARIVIEVGAQAQLQLGIE